MQRAALVEKEIRRVQLARESLPMRQLDAILGGMIFAERRRADEARDALERGEPASFVIERMLNALHDDHVALFNVREYVASASA
jgi:hypothetical protein